MTKDSKLLRDFKEWQQNDIDRMKADRKRRQEQNQITLRICIIILGVLLFYVC